MVSQSETNCDIKVQKQIQEEALDGKKNMMKMCSIVLIFKKRK